MKLIRYEIGIGSAERLGVQLKDSVLDTGKLGEHLNLEVPHTMDEFLNQTKTGLSQFKTVIEKAKELNFSFDRYKVPPSKIHYLPLVRNPEKILCVGMNFIEHIKATDGEVPTTPLFFSKFSNALAGHNQDIPLPPIAQQVDYEGELVIVIGEEIQNACERIARQSILGYTVGNDLSERALQYQSSQWLIGKSMDYFAPVGPVLVTADEIEDVQNLKITTKRNGTIVQNGSTKDMLFSVEQIVSHASQYMTLKPGDLIFTGTPRGVIAEQSSEDQKWLQPQETIDVTIEEIGTLSNKMI